MGNSPVKSYSRQVTFCAFVRHGESVDEILSPTRVIPRSEEKECDAPLTKIGVAQSIITGQYLKKYFEDDLRPTRIVVKASPFIKSIMTACAIATQLGSKFHPTVEIDFGLLDVLSSRNYDLNPLPELEISRCHSKQDLENLKRKYKIAQRVQIKIENYKAQLYPEKSEAGLIRFLKYWIKAQSCDNEGKTAVVHVSHSQQVNWASAVERLASKRSNDPEKQKFLDLLEIIQTRKSIDKEILTTLKNLITSNMMPIGTVCGVNAGLHTDENHKLIFYGLKSHLETKLAVEQIKFIVGIKR